MLHACLRPQTPRPGLSVIRLYSKKIKGLQFPEPPTKEHNSRASFLEYATRTGLDSASTVYHGTLYEYTVQESLHRFGMNLQRSGGAFDKGIDLVGTWSIPQFRKPLKIIVSCKVQGKTTQTGPRLIRELEGSFAGAPPGWREPGVLGFFVAPKAATKGMRDTLGRSRWPMGCAMCSSDGIITQLLWNQTASECGLGHLGVGIRYTGHNPPQTEVVLMWKGEAIASRENNIVDPDLKSEPENGTSGDNA